MSLQLTYSTVARCHLPTEINMPCRVVHKPEIQAALNVRFGSCGLAFCTANHVMLVALSKSLRSLVGQKHPQRALVRVIVEGPELQNSANTLPKT